MTLDDLSSIPLELIQPLDRPKFYVGLFDRDPEEEVALEPDYIGYNRVPLGRVLVGESRVANIETISFPGVPRDYPEDLMFDVEYVGIFMGDNPPTLLATARLNKPMRLASWGPLGPLIPEFSPGSLEFYLDNPEQPCLSRAVKAIKDFYKKVFRRSE